MSVRQTIVAKLDRLSRSVVDFGGILRTVTSPRRGRKPRGLVAVEMRIDMTAPTGRLVAHVLIAVAEWEGRTISDRNCAALAVAKREYGVMPTPAAKVPDSVVTGVKRARSGASPFGRSRAASMQTPSLPFAVGAGMPRRCFTTDTARHAA